MGHYENGDGVPVPFDPSNMPKSGLFKVKLQPNEAHSLKLGGIWYKNAFYVQSGGYDWSINNQTYTANYRFTPDSDLVDLKLNAYYNLTDLAFDGIGGVFTAGGAARKPAWAAIFPTPPASSSVTSA